MSVAKFEPWELARNNIRRGSESRAAKQKDEYTINHAVYSLYTSSLDYNEAELHKRKLVYQI